VQELPYNRLFNIKAVMGSSLLPCLQIIKQLTIKKRIMETVRITSSDGKSKNVKVGKYVHPYPISIETKNEIIRVQKSTDQVTSGIFSFEEKEYRFSKVIIDSLPTWFIEGHPLLTFYEYNPYEKTVQVKMGSGGDWTVSGERRKEYQAFVYNVLDVLRCTQFPVFNDSTDVYYNVMSSSCNHPSDIIK
jgi:hypothetical protein